MPPATEMPLAMTNIGAFMDGPPADAPAAPAPAAAAEKPATPPPTPPAAAPAPAKAEPAAKPAAPAAPAADGESVESLEALEEPKPGHWKKLKSAYRTEREQFQTKLKASEDRLKELETNLKTAQDAQAKAGEPSPELDAKVKTLEQQLKDYSEKLMVLDVTQHPRFVAYFEGKKGEQMAAGKAILGEEKFGEFQKLADLPNGDYKNAQLEEFIAGLPVLQQTRFGAVLNGLDAVARERDQEIAKANTHRETLAAQNAEQHKQALTNRDKMIAAVAAEFQDAKTGFAAFQKREGDTAWNAQVEARVALAKAFLTEGAIKDRRQIAQAAFHAAAFPAVLEAYKADMAEHKATIGKLEAQVKALSAAAPTSGATADVPGDPPKKEWLNRTMQPFEVENAFANLMDPNAQ